MSLGIIIINYNGNTDTIECLDSINTLYGNIPGIKVFLIDNNSTEKIDKEILENYIYEIIYIQCEKNEGFARGNNIGIKAALRTGCEYIALINNDTVFVDDSLLMAHTCMKGNPEYGILGLVNYYYSDPSTIWQAGFKSYFYLGHSRTIKYLSEKIEIIPVDYIPGSSMVMHRSVYGTIGYLDERYFAYFEEHDYCIRAKKHGISVGYLSGTKILHKVGKSSTSIVQLYFRTRNKLTFYSEHAPVYGFIIATTLHLVVSVKRIMLSGNERKRMFLALFFGVRDYFIKKMYEGSINELK